MATDILKKVQENLGLTPVKKIDPNTQDLTKKADFTKQRFEQAVLTATMAAIYNLNRSEQGMNILEQQTMSNAPRDLFGITDNDILSRIAHYSHTDVGSVATLVSQVAGEALKVIHANSTSKLELSNLVGSQRNNILPYLPAELQLGSFIADDTMDDRTNKMQGPVSSLMHKIESSFSGNETKEEADQRAAMNK